ncbi:MAG: YggS family pyridoxal phosphate-dependent enzyme [Parvibaculum sp.]
MTDVPLPTAHPFFAVKASVDKALSEAGRAADSATLVVVSKTQPAEAILPVLEVGHRVFGENRVQEAHAKWPLLRETYPDIELHLIGPLQTNKAGEALQLFDVIETLDREKLARAFVKERDKGVSIPRLLIQVNTGAEPQKAGVLPEALDAFIVLCRDTLSLPVEGLMCIPPAEEEPALHFALLEKLAKRNGLSILSMGMSADFETALEFGATHVRVGSAIFGART